MNTNEDLGDIIERLVNTNEDYEDAARLLLGDIIERLVNQPKTIEQAEMMKAALEISIYKLIIKFALRKDTDENT